MGRWILQIAWHCSRCCYCWWWWSLRWRHNGCDSVSNHQPRECLLRRLIRRTSKKTSKLRVTGLCAGNSPETGEFPAQMASNAENVSVWWRHHVVIIMIMVVIITLVLNMITSSNGNIFRVTGPLCREFTQSQGQWREALMFSLICAWANGSVNNRDARDLRRHRAHYDVIVMKLWKWWERRGFRDQHVFWEICIYKRTKRHFHILFSTQRLVTCQTYACSRMASSANTSMSARVISYATGQS